MAAVKDETDNVRTSQLTEKSEVTIDVKEISEENWKPTWKQLMIMITMAISSLVVALDATILTPVLPTLAVDLHGSAAEAFWTGTAYLLAHSVLQPAIASLSDIFGRRELLVPSLLCFAAGSIVCGVAHNFTTMLIGRVIQGIGGAGIITLSQVIFADLVPLRYRPKYFTMVLGAWAVGSLLGPLIGGVLVEKATWRWVFYLNLPICGLALPMAVFFLGALNKPKTDLITKIRSIDWTGNTLFIASLTSLLVAVSWAGVQYDWSSWRTVTPLVLGSAGLVGSIIYEMKVPKNPFLVRAIFANWSAIAGYSCAVLQGLALYMALYYTSFYFSASHFYSPIRTGVSLFPATAALLPGSAVVSSLIARLGKFRWAIWAGFFISTVASGTYIMWNERTKIPVWAACQCFFGAGMGMILSSVNVAVQAAVDPEHASAAASMYAFMRSIGMTVGVAIGGTIFQNVMRHELIALGVPRAHELAQNSEAFIEDLKKMSTTGPTGVVRQHIMTGYTHGFRGIWITMCAMCAVGLIFSVFIKGGNLDKALQSRFAVQEDEEAGNREK